MSIDLWNTNSGLYRKRYWIGRKLIQKKTTRKPTIVLGITFRASRLFSFRGISQCLHCHGAFWDGAICFRTSCNRCRVTQQHFAILQDLSSSHKDIGRSSLRLVWSIMIFHTSNIEWIIAAPEMTTCRHTSISTMETRIQVILETRGVQELH